MDKETACLLISMEIKRHERLRDLSEDFAGDHDAVIEALEMALEALKQDRFLSAFSDITFYQGQEKWANELADKLGKLGNCETLKCSDACREEWCTDKHFLWMMLCSAFGDWGTSIRTGWIDKPEEARKFILRAIEEKEGE